MTAASSSSPRRTATSTSLNGKCRKEDEIAGFQGSSSGSRWVQPAAAGASGSPGSVARDRPRNNHKEDPRGISHPTSRARLREGAEVTQEGRQLLFEHVMEPGTGKAVPVLRGQILRMEQIGNGQCADFNAYNLHDYK